jgi:carbon monoxide dehydrogenase subunit G
MTLRYKGEVHIQANRALVWDLMTDAGRIARCFPDAADIVIEDDCHFRAKVPIDVGPMRGRLHLEAEVLPDPAKDRLSIVIGGTGFASSLALSAIVDFSESQDGSTRLTWRGEAEARGAVSMARRETIDEHARTIIARGFAFLKENVGAQAAEGTS